MNITRIIDMPTQIRGAVVEDENGDNNIYLNARYTAEAREETFEHELRHIKYGHLHDDLPIELKEEQAKYGG